MDRFTGNSQRSHRIFKVTVLAISLAAAILMAEAGLRWTKPPDHNDLMAMRISSARRQGLPFDSRTTLEVLNGFRVRGIGAFPPIKPINFLKKSLEVEGHEVIPLAGVAEVLTVFNANETGERFIYRSDEYGFNNPPGLHLKDSVEIAVIGDSFAQGVAVLPEQGIAAQLRNAFPKTLNLGMGASGPITELAILREYAQPLRPQTVLWLYYEANDLTDAENESHNTILREYLNGQRRPSLRRFAGPLNDALIQFSRNMVADHEKALTGMPRQPSRLEALLTLTETRRRIVTLTNRVGDLDQRRNASYTNEDGLDLFRRALKKARDWTEAWNGQLVFVYLPEYNRFSQRWDLHGDSLQRPEVLAFLEQQNIPTIDLVPVFEKHEDPSSLFPFSLPGHYTAEGYEQVAQAIVYGLASKAHKPTPLPLASASISR